MMSAVATDNKGFVDSVFERSVLTQSKQTWKQFDFDFKFGLFLWSFKGHAVFLGKGWLRNCDWLHDLC